MPTAKPSPSPNRRAHGMVTTVDQLLAHFDGVHPRQLAEHAGCTRTNVYAWRQGALPMPETLLHLAATADLTMHELGAVLVDRLFRSMERQKKHNPYNQDPLYGSP